MFWTGNQDAQLNQVVNLVIETVPSLPVHSPTFEGRFIFVNTPGMDFGLHFASDTAWVKIAVSGSLTILNDLQDVEVPNPTNGQVLTYVTSQNRWESANPQGGGGASFQQQQLIVTATDTVGPLSDPPTSASVVMIFVNGQLRVNGVDFTVSGQNISWVSPTLSVEPSDTLIAYYPVTLTSGNVIQEVIAIPSPDTPNPLSSSPQDQDDVMVFINGQLRTTGVDYTISGTTINWISPTLSIDSSDTLIAYYQTF